MVRLKGIFKKVITSDNPKQTSVSDYNTEERTDSTKQKKKKKNKRRSSNKPVEQQNKEITQEENDPVEIKETNLRKSKESATRDSLPNEGEVEETDVSCEEDDGSEEYEDDLEEDSDEDTLDLHFENPEEHDFMANSANFKTLTLEEIVTEQREQINRVAELFEIPTSTATTLLKHFQWKEEVLKDRYFDDSEKVLMEAGIGNISADTEVSGTMELVGDEFMCSICFTEVTSEECTALKCSHCFCNDCWKEYLQIKIREGEILHSRIKCPHKDCNLTVDEDTIKSLVDEEIYEKYAHFITKSFVESSDGRVKWCPQPNCTQAITVDMISGTVVKCVCGFRFCFSCHREAHNPASCEQVKAWQQKCIDDSETSHWKYANTKDCPKCESPVEKNGGCNHMTCRQCKHEWCWVCTRPWKGHNDYYNCNKYLKPEKRKKSFSILSRSKKKERILEREAEREKNRIALERYIHFFERYANHSQSSELEKQIRSRALAKVAELQRESATTTSEVQYILDGTEELLECRNVLKYTYVYAYYLPEVGPEKGLFEQYQEDLEKCTEELSEVLEMATSSHDRVKAKNLIEVAQTRKGNLLRAVEEGLLDIQS